MKLQDLIPPGILPGVEEDAIALLRAGHDRIEDLFASFDAIQFGREDAEKSRLVGEICREFRVHAAIEEEIFYPAVRAEIADDDLMNEAWVEHESARRLVTELESMDPADEMLNAKMHVLEAYITHHVREEEENIFPKARDTQLDLAGLASKMMRRKDQLMQTGTKTARTPASRRSQPSPGESRAPR